MSWTKIMTSLTLFQNALTLRKAGVVIFADIIKIVTMFTKTITKDSRKEKNCRICVGEFRKEDQKVLPHPLAASKKPILNRVKRDFLCPLAI